jgi:alpha-2-macroglobulin
MCWESKDGGTYRVTATVQDDRGRKNESELTLWVAGGKQPHKDNVEEEKVVLIPDRKEYKAGDTAEFLVQAPFYPAEAVMTLRRSGIVKTERFRIDGPTYTLRIPIEEAWTPNVHLQVDLVGAEDRDMESAAAGSADILSAGVGSASAQMKTKVDRSESSVRASALTADRMSALPAKRPAFASGEINLSIPPLSRKLNITAAPRDKTLEPSGETIVNVEAKDVEGRAVSDSEVTVVVVDESVLALTNYKLDDPMGAFYSERGAFVTDYHLRRDLVSPDVRSRRLVDIGSNNGTIMTENNDMVQQVTVKTSNYAAEYGSSTIEVSKLLTTGSKELAAIHLRENFNALAVFAPSVRTDANGRAQVQVKLPDNLTRYRVMAVAVAGGKQFGMGESSITARLPLMARPSAPRFLNFGDRFELPIIVQNQTDKPLTVDLAVRATNAVLSEPPAVAGGLSSTTIVSAINRPLPQAVLTGRRVTVPANDRVEVPVWTPATTEAFATYGEIDDGSITQPVKAPADVFKQFGGLEVETSSTQLQQLTDAFLYLQNYPYECSEQLASRILSVAALRDVLSAFKTKEMPSPSAIDAAVARDLKRLQGLQNSDGGFGFWRRGDESWPYLGIHVAHALARAQQKKFEVPKEVLDNSRKYLREIESHIPKNYGIEERRAIIAYALYVRMQTGDRDASRARKLIAEAGSLDNLSLESVGWLLTVLSGDKDSQTQIEAIRRHLNNRATETAADAHFACSYKDGDYLLLKFGSPR